jgi:propionyl-CoA synthetase
LAVRLPLPPGCLSTVWKNDRQFEEHYCGQFPGQLLYSTFDYAVQDHEGYFYILGRTDDVINVAGHRLGTREIEEAISSHPAVAEVAAVGAADAIKGQVVKCFIALKQPEKFSTADARAAVVKEIEAIVEQTLGAFARPSFIGIVAQLPKTRSGKVMRRTILAILEGRDPGDVTTLDDSAAIEGICRAVAQHGDSQGTKSVTEHQPTETNR